MEIGQASEIFRNGGGEEVVGEIEIAEAAEVEEGGGGESSGEIVAGEVERDKEGEVTDERSDGAGEVAVGER